MAKQGLRHLDRHGQASSKDFFVFGEVELLRFVEYDIYYNNLFTIGPLIMCLGAKGVPIGARRPPPYGGGVGGAPISGQKPG